MKIFEYRSPSVAYGGDLDSFIFCYLKCIYCIGNFIDGRDCDMVRRQKRLPSSVYGITPYYYPISICCRNFSFKSLQIAKKDNSMEENAK